MNIDSMESLEDFPKYDHSCPKCGHILEMLIISEFGSPIEVENICDNCAHQFIRFYYPKNKKK